MKRPFKSFAILLLIGGCASSVPLARRVPGVAFTRRTPSTIPSTTPSTQPAASIPTVDLRGSPRELGLAHGRMLGPQIKILQDNYLDVMLADPKVKMVALASASMFELRMTDDQREEITALSEASGMDRKMCLLAQCFLDLRSSMGCSTVSFPGSASPDGVPRMGRNLDFPSLDIADKMSALIVMHPTGKNAFAAVSWPGLIGVLSGMNEHGLCLANMEIRRAMRFPQAMPYTLLYRTILEQCANVDEAIALLQNTPRQSANNLMLMDASGKRAVVEITPEQIIVRRGEPDAALISTNHQRGQDTTSTGLCWRYDLLNKTSGGEFGSIDVPQIEAMLKSAQQNNYTIQSMIFEPSTRTIYLATGKRAADQKFEKIEFFRDAR